MIKVGDSVKIRFHFDPVDGFDAESMWISVTGVYGDEIVGTLDNYPVFTEQHGFEYGDEVTFSQGDVNDHIAVH